MLFRDKVISVKALGPTIQCDWMLLEAYVMPLGWRTSLLRRLGLSWPSRRVLIQFQAQCCEYQDKALDKTPFYMLEYDKDTGFAVHKGVEPEEFWCEEYINNRKHLVLIPKPEVARMHIMLANGLSPYIDEDCVMS